MKRLTADKLADALIAATREDRYRSRAEELSRALALDDGAGEVAAALDRIG